MTAEERSQLLTTCSRHRDNIRGLLSENVLDWQITDLAIGWRDLGLPEPHYPKDLANQLLRIAKPDITLTASWYFGVGPIKQITHTTPGYFRGTKEEFTTEIGRRKSELDSIVQCVREQSAKAGEVISGYASEVAEFHTTWEQKWKQRATGDAYPFYSYALDMGRKGRFRIGSSPNSETKICNCRVKGKDCTHGSAPQEFEIYVPVHRMFASQISELIESMGGSAHNFSLAACGKKDPGMKDLRSDGNLQPFLVLNYWVFPLHCQPSNPWNAEKLSNFMSNPVMSKLIESGFEYFGKIFMAIMENGAVKLFDLIGPDGHVVPSEERDLLPDSPCNRCETCEIRVSHIDCVTATAPCLFFRFTSWRQPQ